MIINKPVKLAKNHDLSSILKNEKSKAIKDSVFV